MSKHLKLRRRARRARGLRRDAVAWLTGFALELPTSRVAAAAAR
jgi:hypothetical protein